MRTIIGVWRWRHNPLRRPTDLAEAWVALTALLLIVVAAPLAGVLSATMTHDALVRAVKQQRTQRTGVTATVLRTVQHGSPADPDPETSPVRGVQSVVIAKWTAPDGSSRQGRVTSSLRAPHPGDRFGIWTDSRGLLVGRPMNRATAATHAVLAGVGAALTVAGAAQGVRHLIMWRLLRRRYTAWDRAWDKAGPDWGRTGAGS